ncbi:MAG TPA: dienelactone hydrolase family protein, partial [Nitrososphaerales archaeon]|nr:dienelactone hydrolase family protein [Nitrososphaerales archaeon]
KEDLVPNAPVSPLDYAGGLSCPMLGLFGKDDRNPDQQMVAQIEAELKRLGKDYEFHNYPNAGHGFFYYDRAQYRQEAAEDGWNRIWSFLGKNLGGSA